jgi:hypothetical protein
MPSRRSAAFIIMFWFIVTGYILYRDVWPLLFATGPPPIAVDLADEAAQNIPIRWTVHWNEKVVGKLTTQMRYVEEDDTFRFTNTYHQVRVEMAGVTVVVPELKSVIRVTRAGDLREQSAEGRLELEWNGVKVADVTTKLAGNVADGQLAAKFDGSYSIAGLAPQSLSKVLAPVPVPRGQPLNPLQPVNRIANVRPGRRWVVHESNPLKDAVEAVARQIGLPPQEEVKVPLVGEVLGEPRNLDRQGNPVPCWVIEYRRDEPEVRTWVRVSDGKVLRQEAFKKGDRLSVDREE